MKRIYFIILFIVIIPYTITSSYVIYTIPVKKTTKKIKYLKREDFYNYAAYPESRCLYNIANNYLMVGKYQASSIALKSFGYSDEKIDKIKSSIYYKTNSKNKKIYYFDEKLFPKKEQERFIEWYINIMEHVYLKKYIKEYTGKTIDGVYITKAGILGTSMFGHIYVKKFLRTNGSQDFKDKYGSSVKNRLKYFENVEIEF